METVQLILLASSLSKLAVEIAQELGPVIAEIQRRASGQEATVEQQAELAAALAKAQARATNPPAHWQVQPTVVPEP